MRHLGVRQDNRIPTTDFEREDFDTVEVLDRPADVPKSTAGETDQPRPIQPVAERFPALEEQEVVFTFSAPEAREVNVAGDFNRWRPEATPLKNTGQGEWVARLLLRSGQYEYRFVVDGRWAEDSQATQRVANPYGSFNSMVVVPLSVRTSIL
jgi:1,4-alpha-glucan branching enzyme